MDRSQILKAAEMIGRSDAIGAKIRDVTAAEIASAYVSLDFQTKGKTSMPKVGFDDPGFLVRDVLVVVLQFRKDALEAELSALCGW